MKTSNRALFLTNYISKTQISNHLEISRPTFDLYLLNGNWKNYQVDKLNKIFEYVKNMLANKSIEITKVYFKNDVLMSDVKIRRV